MGIEQGTPVVDSRIDLLPHIDLLDPRLPRAFKAWTDFKTKHEPQIASIGTLPVEDAVALGDELSIAIGQAIGIEVAVDQSRRIDGEKVRTLTNSISGEGNRVIFMRHGEQSPPQWIYSMPNPGLRKIRMMQDPFNRDDLLTNQGLVNVFVTAFGLFYVTQATGKNLHVLSSENSRAKEVARIVSIVIPDATLSTLDGLTCITYKDERDNPPVTIEELLEDLPSGFMPWDTELIDKWCKATKSGTKPSEVITQTIEDLIRKGTEAEGADLFLVLTHTQQLAEVLRLRGKLENPSIRFSELTMFVLGDINDCLVLERGILPKKGVMEAIV